VAKLPADVISLDYQATDPDLTHTLTQKGLTDEAVGEVLELTQWAWVELNYRPHAYQPPQPGDDQRPPM